MIICVDGIYFNPLQITTMWQNGLDVLVYFTDSAEQHLRFKKWKVEDLAAHINSLIKEF